MKISEKINEIFKDNVVGAQIAVFSRGEIYKYNYGTKSLQADDYVVDDTIFRIASISKIIVTMAALKLYEEGKLDLEADLSDIFGFPVRNPKYPDIKLTPKMLMLHTSSITDGYDDENPKYDNLEKGYNGVLGHGYYVALEDLLHNTNSKFYSENTYSKYKPGTNFIYSNFGTGILACVIEKVSGELFTKYVYDKILSPFGIDASFRAPDLIHKEKVSDAFVYNEKEKVYKATRTGTSFTTSMYEHFPLGNNFRGPAGGLFISMQDLLKIMQCLINDGIYEDIKILEKSTVDYMLQTHFINKELNYKAKGLSLKIIDDFSITLKGHTGGAYGISSYMFFSREEQIGICFITNGGKLKTILPGLDNIQARILEAFVQEFRAEVPINQVVIDLKERTANFNDRKIVLKNVIVEANEIYLTVEDASSLLNLVPVIMDEKIFINNKQLVAINGNIDFKKLLNDLNIKYFEKNNTLEFYL